MADADDRHLQTQARLAGFAYLLQNALFFTSLIMTSRMMVAGDFAATGRNIAAHESLYRAGLSLGVLASASTTFLAWAFYVLLKRVDRNLALFAMMCRASEAVLYAVFYLLYFIGLEICRGGANGLDPAGQQALWTLVSRAETDAGTIASVFFCLGVPVFFYLFFRARFIPRLISAVGLLTAFAILISVFLTAIAPTLGAQIQVVVGLPLAAAEILTGAWLLIGGANTKYWGSRPAAS